MSLVRRQGEERLYRTYVTDMLKHIVNNSAGMETRVHVDTRYIELAMKGKEKEKPKKPEPTSEEIIDRMKNKLRNLAEER